MNTEQSSFIKSHWSNEGRFSPEQAQILRACRCHQADLLQLDPWMPYPQRSCSFAFGEQARPLPIGALFLLWEQCPVFTTSCQHCGGSAWGVYFGGLLSVGGVVAYCSSCGLKHFNSLGGFSFMANLVRPYLESTLFKIARMSYGGWCRATKAMVRI
ncbi:MAG: hypothetical protein P9M14_15775 [Candidatus Alcyoniella australis]|nr:hypothetical protein [Candidatus Alcyoniella australis]